MIINSLLGVANVNPPDGKRWSHGYNASARECAVQMEVEDPCPADPLLPAVGAVSVLGTVDSVKGNYLVRAFPIRSFLRQSVTCEQPDDKDWLMRVAAAKAEYVIARSLVVKMAADVETWIGDAAARNAATVSAAYVLWMSTVASEHGQPIMHVPASMVAGLVTTGVLGITPDGVFSSLGTPVVISAGYEKGTPQVFFTGDIIVRMTGVDDEGGPLYTARMNDYILGLNQWGAVDLTPCAIIRVGA